MAFLRTADVTQRLVDILDEKYETHKLLIGADVPELAEVAGHPLEVGVVFPFVGITFVAHDVPDSPQDTGSANRIDRYRAEIVHELLSWTTENAAFFTDIMDAVRVTLLKEQKLLDPTSGFALPWIYKAWPGHTEAEWLDYETEGGIVQALMDIDIIIDEGETY